MDVRNFPASSDDIFRRGDENVVPPNDKGEYVRVGDAAMHDCVLEILFSLRVLITPTLDSFFGSG
jgi:hypothetical protein